jgi:hypothetical protein
MKEGVVKVLKTLEKAVKSRQTLTHTETFDASPDAVWKAVHNLDNIVPKYLPDVFESSTNVSGQYYGKPGGIRVVKFGPGMENCLRFALPFLSNLNSMSMCFSKQNILLRIFLRNKWTKYYWFLHYPFSFFLEFLIIKYIIHTIFIEMVGRS